MERIAGAHCYEFFAGARRTSTALADEEPGTFYLTDYLVRHFDRLMVEGPRPRPASRSCCRLFRQLPARRLSRAGRGSRRWPARRGRPPTGWASPSSGAPPGSAASPHFLDVPAQPEPSGASTMAQLTIVYWRDIPAQVIVKAGPRERQARAARALRRRRSTWRRCARARPPRTTISPTGAAPTRRRAATTSRPRREAAAARLRGRVRQGPAQGASIDNQGRAARAEDCLHARSARRLRTARQAPARAGSWPPAVLSSVRHARAWSASTPCSSAAARAAARRSSRRSATSRLERPVAAVERRGQGRAVRLPHVRPVHPVLDRHVLPDELPEGPAQRPLRRRARERQLRGLPGDALRLGAGLGGQPADDGAATASPRCSRRSIIASRARRPGCAVVREKASDRASTAAKH